MPTSERLKVKGESWAMSLLNVYIFLNKWQHQRTHYSRHPGQEMAVTRALQTSSAHMLAALHTHTHRALSPTVLIQDTHADNL